MRAEVLHLFTGLDLEHDTIIEIACLITDGNLENTLEVAFPPAFCAFANLCPKESYIISKAICQSGSRDVQDRQQCLTHASGEACCAGARHSNTPP